MGGRRLGLTDVRLPFRHEEQLEARAHRGGRWVLVPGGVVMTTNKRIHIKSRGGSFALGIGGLSGGACCQQIIEGSNIYQKARFESFR